MDDAAAAGRRTLIVSSGPPFTVEDPDFILAVGDDRTDEHMFAVLPGPACSVRVGIAQSLADYNLRDTAAGDRAATGSRWAPGASQAPEL